MTGSCERPGCSEAAEVAYGFLTDPYVIWIDDLGAHERDHAVAGVLCRRHADSMVPPIGWTLDDRRVAAPRLFEPSPLAEPSAPSAAGPATATPAPVATAGAARGTRRRGRRSADATAELPLYPAEHEAGAVEPAPPTDPAGDTGSARSATGPTGPPSAEPWRPVFDGADDLDGLLDAKSPLLSRAFRAGTTSARREPTA